MSTLPHWPARFCLAILPLLGCGAADPQPVAATDTAVAQDALDGAGIDGATADTAVAQDSKPAVDASAVSRCEKYRLRASENHGASFSILYGLNAGGKTAPVEGSFQILSSSEESAKVTMGSLLSSMSFAWHPGDGEWRGPGAEKLALPVAAGAAVPIFVRWAPTASQELGQLKMTVEDCPPLKADLKGVP